MSKVIDRLTGLGYDVFRRNRSAYILLDGPLSWKQARRKARRLGGDLTSIDGPKENDFITRKFAPPGGRSLRAVDRLERRQEIWRFSVEQWQQIKLQKLGQGWNTWILKRHAF